MPLPRGRDVIPILKKYGFGATFFVTEGFDFTDNKTDYMTWEEISQLHRDGFEIGNHTRDHLGAVNRYTVIAMRDLAKYVNPEISPRDSGAVIKDRQAMISAGKSRENSRTPANKESN